jgi:hypothetical protein
MTEKVEKSWECEYCRARFKNKQEAIVHEKQHGQPSSFVHDESDYQCQKKYPESIIVKMNDGAEILYRQEKNLEDSSWIGR